MGDVRAAATETTSARRGFALDLVAVLAPYGRQGRLAVRVERMRDGARLSKGRNNGDNSWSLSPEEIEGVLYLPPDDRVHADRLALRIIELNEEGGTTLAVVDFPLAPTDALSVPSGGATGARGDDGELEHLRQDLTAAQALVAAREEELAELRRTAELAASATANRSIESELTAAVEIARASWETELQQRLADAAAALETSRALAQAEQANQLARVEANARATVEAARAEVQAEREALRASAQAEHAAALAAAQTAWRAEADARLAEMERRRAQAEQALTAVTARLERTERALNETRTQAQTDDGEVRRLREALAALTATLETAKGELAQWRQKAELAAEESAKKHDVAAVETVLATARSSWEAELKRRLEEAAAAADAHLAASRAAWQAEEAERRIAAEARLEERIEERLAAAREEGRQAAGAPPTPAPAAESGALAELSAAREAAERELSNARTARDEAAREGAALAKRLERSEGALAQARAQAERDEAELARLRQGVADLSARLDEREADLLRAQAALDEAQRGRDVGVDPQRQLIQRVLQPSKAAAPRRRSRAKRLVPVGAIAALAAAALAFYWNAGLGVRGEWWPQLVSLAIGDEPAAPGTSTEPPAPSSAAAVLRRGTIGATGANLRASPSTGAAVIATLPRDAEVTLVDRRGSWMQVRAMNRDGTRQQEGWVYAPSVKEARSAQP